MIIDRYLRREIARPLLPVLAVLIVLFAGFTAAAFLSDAIDGLLPARVIARLVGLKVLISLEVLIPVALYVSVVVSFGRMHSDGEFLAAQAVRMTPAKVTRAVLAVSITLALTVAGLSLAVRPWAYGKLHLLTDHAESMLDVDQMRPDTFYVGQHGDRVIFFSRQDGPGSPAQDVFVQLWRGDRARIIHARLAYDLTRAVADGGSRIVLRDAHVYEIGLAGGDDQILSARDMVLDPNDHGGVATAYSSVAASSLHLARSSAAPDIAELQWRLSTPVSTLLLGLLGVPVSRTRPRQSRYGKLAAAILIYFGYYVLFTSARTWVQHGAIAELPGIWWVPALLSLFLLLAPYGPGRAEHGRA